MKSIPVIAKAEFSVVFIVTWSFRNHMLIWVSRHSLLSKFYSLKIFNIFVDTVIQD